MHDSLKNSMAWVREQSLLLKRKPSFVFLLLVGSLLSVLARLWAGGNMGATIALVICVGFLVVYAYQSFDSADPHAPENLYYMGLLFTLVSLMYSLIVLFIFDIGEGDEGDVGKRVYNLVGSFGIALVSTFTGIFLRIVLLQKTLTQDDREIEGQARRDLAETARKLRRELTQTVTAMGGFRRDIVQATANAVRELEQKRSEMVRQVKKVGDEQDDMFGKMTEKIGGKLAKAGDDAAAVAGNVKKLLDDLVKQQEKQRQDLIAMGENSGELARAYNALNAEIRQTTKLFSDAAREVKQVAETISADTNALSESMSEMARIAPQHTQQFAHQITVLRQEATKWQSMTQEVRTTMLQAVKSLTDAIKGK